MFRLYKAELKKIFLKPSIFVVTGLIILMLAVSGFIYKPVTKDSYLITYNNNNIDIGGYYSNFTTGKVNSKSDYDGYVEKAQEYIDFYKGTSDNVVYLQDQWANVKAKFSTYNQKYAIWLTTTTSKPNPNDQLLKTSRDDFKISVTNFKNDFLGIVEPETTTILLTSSTKNAIIGQISVILNKFTLYGSGDDDLSNNGTITKEIYDSKALDNITNLLKNDLKVFSPDKELIDSLQKYVDEATQRCEAINNEIVEFKNEVGETSHLKANLDKMRLLITKYGLTSTNAYNIVIDSAKVSGLSHYTALNITQFYKYDSANYYEMKERLTKNKYIFDSNTYSFEYADPFSVSQPSNSEVNGFDYSYFATRLCTFFITIYIVVLAAGTIAGEQSSGTLKLLSIRPYSRSKVMTCKLLATITIGAILLLISGLASLVIGGSLYGLSSLKILGVFNASKAFVIHPLFLYVIALITILLEICFYAVLSIFISTCFKSNVGAVSVSTLLFFVSLILNVIAVNVPFLGFIPFTSTNLFKYFGSAFLSNSNSFSLMESILTPTVFSGCSFWISFTILIITIGVITYINYYVYNKRDIK